jgi:hypothetical protein
MASESLLLKLNSYEIYITGRWFKSNHNDTKIESRNKILDSNYNTPRLGLDVAAEWVALLFSVWEVQISIQRPVALIEVFSWFSTVPQGRCWDSTSN